MSQRSCRISAHKKQWRLSDHEQCLSRLGRLGRCGRRRNALVACGGSDDNPAPAAKGQASLRRCTRMLQQSRHRRHHADAGWPADRRLSPVLPDRHVHPGRPAQRRSQVDHACIRRGLSQSLRRNADAASGAGRRQVRLLPDCARLPRRRQRHPVDPRLGEVDRQGRSRSIRYAPPRFARSWWGGTPRPTCCTRSSDLDSVDDQPVAAQRLCVIDLKHNVAVIADEAIGELLQRSRRHGRAWSSSILAAGTSRRRAAG